MNNKQYGKVRTLILYTKKYDLSEIEVIPANLIYDMNKFLRSHYEYSIYPTVSLPLKRHL